jgi:hypothetical protein
MVRGQAVVSDAPQVCGVDKDFCVALATSSTSTTLAIIQAATGTILYGIPGPERSMDVLQPGTATLGSLWQTSASSLTLAQLSPTNQLVWQRPVSQLFGNAEYSPDNSWDFSTRDGLDVGSLGLQPDGTKFSLHQYKNIAISVTSGNVVWQVPGWYDCFGNLGFLAPALVCDFSGDIIHLLGRSTFFGLGLTFKGIDITNGRTVWAEPVGNARFLLLGGSTPFLDDTTNTW